MFAEYIQHLSGDDRSMTAAEHIDTLTFNRIKDFNSLTEFQRRIIKRVHNRLTDFERENEDILDSQLQSYSLNGVSMSFNNQSVKHICGVVIPSELYSLLVSTGLCYPAI